MTMSNGYWTIAPMEDTEDEFDARAIVEELLEEFTSEEVDQMGLLGAPGYIHSVTTFEPSALLIPESVVPYSVKEALNIGDLLGLTAFVVKREAGPVVAEAARKGSWATALVMERMEEETREEQRLDALALQREQRDHPFEPF